MATNAQESLESVQERFCSALCSVDDQVFSLSLLLRSIEHCESLGSPAWSVTLLENGFRLNVGDVEALSLWFSENTEEECGIRGGQIFVTLGLMILEDPSAPTVLPESVGRIAHPVYANVSAPHSCHWMTFHASKLGPPDPTRVAVAEHVTLIWAAHKEYLNLACHKPKGGLRIKTRHAWAHCPALITYARHLVEHGVPPVQVDTGETSKEITIATAQAMADDPASRAARLTAAPEIPERYMVLTTAYRRNPDVVAEVLIRAGGVCESCSASAPFLKDSDGSPYLEVHHKKRLADGGFDTVANAIALCPNCHRNAHFGNLNLS